MALTALPLSDSFPLVWEHDPALDRERPDFAHAYQVALETLDWEPLIIPGKQPTKFHFRPLRGSLQRRLMDMGTGGLTGLALIFRASLVRIENFPECPAIKRKRDAEYTQLGELVGEDVTDFLDAVPLSVGQPSGSLVSTLGGHVFSRSLGLNPKS